MPLEKFLYPNHKDRFWEDNGSYFLNKDEIETVKQNGLLESSKPPHTSAEVIEAATNGVGRLITEHDDGTLQFIGPGGPTGIAMEITLTVFTGLKKLLNQPNNSVAN